MQIPLPDSEDSLVEQAIKGDEQAFAALYDRHVDRVYRSVFYWVSNQADAEDMTQEAFIKAWKSIDRYKRTGAPLIAWLTTIARNLVIDHYRVRKKEVLLEVETMSNTPETDPETVTETSLTREYMKNAVLKLKGEKQKVIIMRFIDGLEYTDIAKAMKKSEGAIRIIQFRALKDLRRILNEDR